ncbi:hypothetical protein FQN60_018492, partial [Etheostoma spectabile]
MTTPALLPLSGRRIPTLSPGASSFPHHRATLRLSEKFILLLILSAFITLCFGAFFFLPDNSKHKRFDLGLEDVLIPHIDSPKEGKHASGQVVIHGQGGHDEHRHREEEESLRDKIRADHERALQEAKEKLRKSREELQAEIQTEKNKVMEDLKKKDAGPKPLPPVPMPKVVGVSDGEPPEPDAKEKRDKIRECVMESHEAKNTMKLLALVFISLAACLLQGERDGGFGYSSSQSGIKRQAVRQADMLMMKHAWDSYRQYGWGHNELKPLAKKGHSTNIFVCKQFASIKHAYRKVGKEPKGEVHALQLSRNPSKEEKRGQNGNKRTRALIVATGSDNLEFTAWPGGYVSCHQIEIDLRGSEGSDLLLASIFASKGVTLPPLPIAYLQVMKVAEGRETGVVCNSRGDSAPQTVRPICQDLAGGQGILLSALPALLQCNSQLGATIVDALDTLYIMGLHEEFKDGQEWIEQNLDFGV